MASVEQIYGNCDKTLRDANYSAALGVLARTYPDDLDARALYALSILGLTSTRNEANYMRAAAEVEAVYEIDKHHPGALHYFIQAYDDPIHAPLGLRAAQLYGKVAPAAAHAQHMPSHIFFALGLSDDAIEANVTSLKLSRVQNDDGGYHALVWLTYAYLQENKVQEAERLVRSVERDVDAGPTKENRLRLASARAIWLVETRGTEGPDAYSSVDSSGIASIGYFNAYDFARGITAAANTTEARKALVRLRARTEAATLAEKGVHLDWHDTVTAAEFAQAVIMATALDGTIRSADCTTAALRRRNSSPALTIAMQEAGEQALRHNGEVAAGALPRRAPCDPSTIGHQRRNAPHGPLGGGNVRPLGLLAPGPRRRAVVEAPLWNLT